VRALPHAREVAPALVLPHVAQDAARRPPLALTPCHAESPFSSRPLKLKETRKRRRERLFNAVGFKESSTVLFTEEPTLSASLTSWVGSYKYQVLVQLPPLHVAWESPTSRHLRPLCYARGGP